MPQGPKGFWWGVKTVFGKPKYQKKGTGCAVHIVTVGTAGVLATWRVAESSGLI